jgi:hypothetical protein
VKSTKANPKVEMEVEEEERDDAIVGVALKWSLAVFLVVGLIAGGIVIALRRPKPPEVVEKKELIRPTVREAPKVQPPVIKFTDVTDSAGIAFRHENGAYGDKLLPETMGGGCAIFDFDGDGDQDILFVNSSRWPWDSRPASQEPATMVLYRNDGRGKFTNATESAGLATAFYGMGVACGDYDNDNDVDLFFTAVGTNHLFRNDGGYNN